MLTRRLLLCIGALAPLSVHSRTLAPHRWSTLLNIAASPLTLPFYLSDPSLRYVLSPSGLAAANFSRQPSFTIEDQRFGAEWVLHGTLAKNPTWIARGWQALDVGVNQQQQDGGWGEYGYYHANSLYLEGLARALVIDPANRTPKRLECLRRGITWMLDEQNKKIGIKQNEPYTHRRYIIAALFGQSSVTLKSKFLADIAEKSAENGLLLQRHDGVNPEKGGFDSNYQMAGIMFAIRYYPTANNLMKTRIENMMRSAIPVELSKINGNGVISIDGSTRMGHEIIAGKAKQPNYVEIFQSFGCANAIIPTPSWERAALAIAKAAKIVMI